MQDPVISSFDLTLLLVFNTSWELFCSSRSREINLLHPPENMRLSSMEWKGSAKGVMALNVVLLCFLSFCILLVCNLAAAGNCSSVSDCSATTIWSGNSNYKAWLRHQAETKAAGGGGRRGNLFLGPGSRPPRCASRCGTCTPCSPVHVSVPPRQHQQQADAAEYYPEAWRCRCGGRLYVP